MGRVLYQEKGHLVRAINARDAVSRDRLLEDDVALAFCGDYVRGVRDPEFGVLSSYGDSGIMGLIGRISCSAGDERTISVLTLPDYLSIMGYAKALEFAVELQLKGLEGIARVVVPSNPGSKDLGNFFKRLNFMETPSKFFSFRDLYRVQEQRLKKSV